MLLRERKRSLLLLLFSPSSADDIITAGELPLLLLLLSSCWRLLASPIYSVDLERRNCLFSSMTAAADVLAFCDEVIKTVAKTEERRFEWWQVKEEG